MDFSVITNNFDFLMKGLRTTLSLSLFSISLSLLIGTVLGLLRQSKWFPLNWICTAFIEITRSIPLILYIIFIHFTFSPLLYKTQIFSGFFGVNSLEFQTAAIALTLFTSAYIAEIVRGGLLSVEKEFVEAAKSLGLNYFQRLRHVILPIAFRRMSPALVNQFVTLTKDTSLASTIGLIELTRSGEIVYERTHQEFEVLLFVALVYFIICFLISYTGEKKLQGHARFKSFVNNC